MNEEKENKLRYKSEDDKCYGATGMAISLVVMDGEEMLSSMSLDRNPGEIMEMHSAFYFSGNPGLSAKAAWQQMKENFGLSVAMLIGNVMCRRMILDKESVEPEIRKNLTERAIQEGNESLGLEPDEIKNLFDKEYTYLFRVFNHQGVHGVAHDFANAFKRRRQLSRLDVLDLLRALGRL